MNAAAGVRSGAQQEVPHGGRRALHVDRDALRGVPDVAGEPELGGQAKDERPEADALHGAADRQP